MLPMANALNILLVIETGGAGSGRHVVDLATKFSANGHHVSVIYSALRAESWFEEALSTLPLVTVYRQAMRRAPHISDISAVRNIRRIIRSDGPFDIIHGHSSKAGALSRLAALGTGCPAVYTPHAFITMNQESPRVMRFIYGRVERWLSSITDALICVSSAEFDHAVDLGLRFDCLRTIPNGARPLPAADRATVRSELGLDPDQVAIGFVGRLEPQKAVDDLISAFALLARTRADVRLVIIGDGHCEPSLRQHAISSGVSDKIIWTGPLDGARAMAGLDIFALSSIYEGFPYVLIEAAFRGLPIVATAVGGTSELVHDGVSGRVVGINDVAAFGAALQSLAQDNELRARMAQASLQMSEQFTAEKMAERTLEMYRDLISAR